MIGNSPITKVLEWARMHAGKKQADRAFDYAPLPEIAKLIQNKLGGADHVSGVAIWKWLFENSMATRGELRRAFPNVKSSQLDTEYSFYTGAMKRIPQNLLSTTTEVESLSPAGQEKREVSEAKVSPMAGTGGNTNTVIQDLCSINDDKEIGATEKIALMDARIGQGLFRDKVIQICGGKCVVTGYDDASFLIASHIKPWRESDNKERLDRYNGLLLTQNLDKAFDKGVVSFEDDGRILISLDFREQANKLGISHEMKASLESRHKPYLALDRRKYFSNG